MAKGKLIVISGPSGAGKTSICNKLLMLVFGAGFLLTYFDPVRYPIGAVGVAVLGFALYKKLSLRATSP